MSSALAVLVLAVFPLADQARSGASASRVLLQLEVTLSTRTAVFGDPVLLRTASDLVVDGVLIPRGSPARGLVTRAVRPGRVRGRAELEVQVESIVAPDGRSFPVRAGFMALPPLPRPRAFRPEPDGRILAGMAAGYATAGLVSKVTHSAETIARSGLVAGVATGILMGVLKRGEDIVLYRGQLAEAVVWPRGPVVR
jgi:hypothetical protein